MRTPAPPFLSHPPGTLERAHIVRDALVYSVPYQQPTSIHSLTHSPHQTTTAPLEKRGERHTQVESRPHGAPAPNQRFAETSKQMLTLVLGGEDSAVGAVVGKLATIISHLRPG